MLETAFGNKTSWKLLRLMIESPGRPISQKEIRQHIKLGFSNLQESLGKLCYSGILKVKKIGGVKHYYLDASNDYTKLLVQLINKEREDLRYVLPSKLAILAEIERRLLNLFPTMQRLILFGSVARRVETKSSDIDLCLVNKESLSAGEKVKLTRLVEEFNKKSLKVQIFDFNEESFNKMMKEQSPLFKEIARDGIELSLNLFSAKL
ncbi:MAG: nucleotidyltransferase domain-containing protein [Candidatus Woesearchaeota archaeon]